MTDLTDYIVALLGRRGRGMDSQPILLACTTNVGAEGTSTYVIIKRDWQRVIIKAKGYVYLTLTGQLDVT